MNWMGLGLAIGGAVVGLVAGFQYHELGWTVTGVVFFAIGIIALSRR